MVRDGSSVVEADCHRDAVPVGLIGLWTVTEVKLENANQEGYLLCDERFGSDSHFMDCSEDVEETDELMAFVTRSLRETFLL